VEVHWIVLPARRRNGLIYQDHWKENDLSYRRLEGRNTIEIHLLGVLGRKLVQGRTSRQIYFPTSTVVT
jgi:hypothetical protein